MPKRTNPFQKLSTSIMKTLYGPQYVIKESVIKRSKETGLPREIDIVIFNNSNPNEKILIECRDHKRPQDVTWIDSLTGKARSLGFKKVLAISSRGFYKTAEIEAKSRGIETMSIKEAKEVDWKKWLFSISVFGIVIDLEPNVYSVKLYDLDGNKPLEINKDSFKKVYLVNEDRSNSISIYDYIKRFIAKPETIKHIRANNKNIGKNYYSTDITFKKRLCYRIKNGKNIPLSKITLFSFSIRKKNNVPLTHIKAGNEKILTGKTKITNRETNLFLHEEKDMLTVMLKEIDQ